MRQSKRVPVVGAAVLVIGLVSPILAATAGAEPPQSRADCKNGGWETLTSDDGAPFRNQGECIAYVTSGDPAGSGKIVFDRFVDGRGEIWTMNTNGTQQRKLTDGYDPAWSPDGTEIVFGRGDDFLTAEIYTMNADGTGETKLTDNAVADYEAAWSPTGEEIVFVRQGENDDTEIYVMNRDGTNERRLTDNQTTDRFPAWSPDGSKIAFASDFPLRIFTMNPDGSDRQSLTDEVAGTGEAYPDWSPDGSQLVFIRVSGCCNGETIVMNADGTNQINITPGGFGFDAPNFSPSGEKIVYVGFGEGGYEGIGTMNADGTNQRKLTDDGFNTDWR